MKKSKKKRKQVSEWLTIMLAHTPLASQCPKQKHRENKNHTDELQLLVEPSLLEGSPGRGVGFPAVCRDTAVHHPDRLGETHSSEISTYLITG